MDIEIINILIVEDNEDDLFFIKKALSNKRYNLNCIMSGIDAYDYLLNPSIQPEIVLLDNKLPGMDGLEILDKINKTSNDYSFIFLTVDNTIETVVQAMKAGALDFIVKTTNLKNELPEKIEKVYEIHRNKIERKKIREELIKAKEKAEESDRLKSAFLENISHEIRTPLNAILGFSNILLEPDLIEEERKHYINILQNSVDQLIAIVENTITLSQLETNQLKLNYMDFSLNKLLSSLFKEYNDKKDILEKTQIVLFLKIPDSVDLKVKTDYTRLDQIFSILLDNAFKFTEKGTIEFGYKLEDNKVSFFIKDTGIGIAEDKQNIIFKKFAHADKKIQQSFGGLGIGLAIATGILKLLGGDISINSQVNVGTEVIFSIPLKE